MNPVRISFNCFRHTAIKEATHMCNNKCNIILRNVHSFSLKSGIQTSLQGSNIFKQQCVDCRYKGNFFPLRILCSPRYYSSEQEDEGQTQSNQTLGKIKGTLLMAYKCKVGVRVIVRLHTTTSTVGCVNMPPSAVGCVNMPPSAIGYVIVSDVGYGYSKSNSKTVLNTLLPP
ncbi:unnamed protein product [Mytilus edulis]|uniref:Uncharacterized protein n=1 Tax=Mytilus edulis TaxID=6550 RepID=A0A8S3RA20_MYTED|nr:unnamed protein product [Mytilus edulis]